MDREQARFVLRSFRPNGADADDADFAEALALAVEDRELGEWLAAERAFDTMFATALNSVDLPENLRKDVVACLSAERGDFPQAEDAADAMMIGALASIHPPVLMRDEILAAMDRTAAARTKENSAWRRFGVPLAVAAGVMLAIFFNQPDQAAPPQQLGQVRAEVVQAGFIRALESPDFRLEEQREDHRELAKHLRSRRLPCPGGLPPGLAKMKGLGCRQLDVDGKQGSLICFKVSEAGVVHLIVFYRRDIEGAFPKRNQPRLLQEGSWAAAQWQDGGKVFILMANTDVEKLANLF